MHREPYKESELPKDRVWGAMFSANLFFPSTYIMLMKQLKLLFNPFWSQFPKL